MAEVLNWAQFDKEKLRDNIFKNSVALYQGLTFIDSQLGTEEEGIIDFLGVDKAGRPVIVDFDTQENDNLIIYSLSQVQWLVKIKSLIKRLYFNENVDFNQTPLILLIAPSFSDKAKSAIKQLSTIEIKFIEYRCLSVQGQDIVVFDEVFYNKKYSHKICLLDANNKEKEEILKRKPVEPEHMPHMREEKVIAAQGVALTAEEIAEFMSFDRSLSKPR